MVPDAPCGGQGKCGKCRILLDGEEVLACRTQVEKDCEVRPVLEGKKHAQILNDGLFRSVGCEPGSLPEGTEAPVLAAVDLGSTTVVAYLMDGRTGEPVKYQKHAESSAPVRRGCGHAVQLCPGTRAGGSEQLYPGGHRPPSGRGGGRSRAKERGHRQDRYGRERLYASSFPGASCGHAGEGALCAESQEYGKEGGFRLRHPCVSECAAYMASQHRGLCGCGYYRLHAGGGIR